MTFQGLTRRTGLAASTLALTLALAAPGLLRPRLEQIAPVVVDLIATACHRRHQGQDAQPGKKGVHQCRARMLFSWAGP